MQDGVTNAAATLEARLAAAASVQALVSDAAACRALRTHGALASLSAAVDGLLAGGVAAGPHALLAALVEAVSAAGSGGGGGMPDELRTPGVVKLACAVVAFEARDSLPRLLADAAVVRRLLAGCGTGSSAPAPAAPVAAAPTTTRGASPMKALSGVEARQALLLGLTSALPAAPPPSSLPATAPRSPGAPRRPPSSTPAALALLRRVTHIDDAAAAGSAATGSMDASAEAELARRVGAARAAVAAAVGGQGLALLAAVMAAHADAVVSGRDAAGCGVVEACAGVLEDCTFAAPGVVAALTAVQLAHPSAASAAGAGAALSFPALLIGLLRQVGAAAAPAGEHARDAAAHAAARLAINMSNRLEAGASALARAAPATPQRAVHRPDDDTEWPGLHTVVCLLATAAATAARDNTRGAPAGAHHRACFDDVVLLAGLATNMIEAVLPARAALRDLTTTDGSPILPALARTFAHLFVRMRLDTAYVVAGADHSNDGSVDPDDLVLASYLALLLGTAMRDDVVAQVAVLGAISSTLAAAAAGVGGGGGVAATLPPASRAPAALLMTLHAFVSLQTTAGVLTESAHVGAVRAPLDAVWGDVRLPGIHYARPPAPAPPPPPPQLVVPAPQQLPGPAPASPAPVAAAAETPQRGRTPQRSRTPVVPPSPASTTRRASAARSSPVQPDASPGMPLRSSLLRPPPPSLAPPVAATAAVSGVKRATYEGRARAGTGSSWGDSGRALWAADDDSGSGGGGGDDAASPASTRAGATGWLGRTASPLVPASSSVASSRTPSISASASTGSGGGTSSSSSGGTGSAASQVRRQYGGGARATPAAAAAAMASAAVRFAGTLAAAVIDGPRGGAGGGATASRALLDSLEWEP